MHNRWHWLCWPATRCDCKLLGHRRQPQVFNISFITLNQLTDSPTKITIAFFFFCCFFNFVFINIHFFLLDLHPCIDIECEKFAHCVAISPHEYTCRCNTSCPSYEEQVCASNGRTFSNLCLLNKEICDTDANFTIYHPGSCTGISLVASSYSWCEWCTKKRLSCI